MRNIRLLALLLVPVCVLAQSPNDKLLQEAQQSPTLEHNLRVLTDEIGGRVPGTPAMARAEQWGVDAFKVAGGENVHTEPVRLAASWKEGNTQVEVVSPVHFRVRAVSLTWTAASASPVQGVPVVDVGAGAEHDFQNAVHVRGAVALVHSKVMKTWDDLFEEYLKQRELIANARKAGAVAVAFISTREQQLLYRHIGSFNDKVSLYPQLMLAREDGERIARLLAAGKKVRLKYSVPNVVGGPITAQNVVAEIRGREKPNEFVVIGAHLDSWELGTGALDNGCNAALVIEALRAIKASGLQPRRTIRFVLFTGEEELNIGSWAYTRAHKAELDNTVAMLTWDEGTGRTTGFSLGGRKDLAAPIARLLEPIKQFDANVLTTDAFVGTDNMDFLLEGVPNLVANQEEANYLINYHAASDTYDKVDLPQLRKHIAIAAYLTYAIADTPERLGPRQDRAQIDELIKETHLDDQLKAFDLWADWSAGKRGRTN
ncbi:MAG TPA: M20/M25/M40 family metallo-hydrolase [Alphaproteobacteria bacterium]|nr:M20/M25/M40 family metallo-hydrolase [Alphaproteobacteria bacterium]